jgi:Uma2 family endonuclease
VVEPDLVVVCDPGKLDDYGCKGAPDLVIEILSPSTRRHDRVVKLDLYQRAGVREYWIVNPDEKTVQVMLLKDGYLLPVEDYSREDTASVNILEDCTIELSKVFTE